MSIVSGPKIITDGLVLFLDAANEKSYPGTGTTWFDLTNDKNNVSLINGVDFNSNNNKDALIFDGINDYANFNNIIADPNNFSFRFILNYNSIQSVAFPRLLAGTVDMEIFNEDLYFRFRWSTSFIDSLNNYIIPGLILDYCIVYSSPSLYFYRNGILFDSKTFSRSNNEIFNTIMNNSQVNRPLNGLLYNFSIYNKELSQQEVLQNFEAFRGRYNI